MLSVYGVRYNHIELAQLMEEKLFKEGKVEKGKAMEALKIAMCKKAECSNLNEQKSNEEVIAFPESDVCKLES